MSLLDPQLHAFLAIVKQGTVHAAATSIHLTQTAVTQRIRGLEQRLHATLFIRTRRGMALTPEGEALLHYCRSVQVMEGETLSKFKGLGQTYITDLKISAPSSLMRSRIIPACIPIMKKFPNLLMHYSVNDVESRHLALQQGECDFAICIPQHVSLEMACKTLMPEEYILVATQKWEKRKLTDVIKSEHIIDFNVQDNMTFNYLRHYGLLRNADKNRHFVNNIEALVELVSSGVGYTVLTKEMFALFAKPKKLIALNQGKKLFSPLSLCWYPRPILPPYFKWVIDSIV